MRGPGSVAVDRADFYGTDNQALSGRTGLNGASELHGPGSRSRWLEWRAWSHFVFTATTGEHCDCDSEECGQDPSALGIRSDSWLHEHPDRGNCVPEYGAKLLPVQSFRTLTEHPYSAMAEAPNHTTWIALFRGINVGGNNILPMAELRNELAASGFSEVNSYIQSGNVVFRAGTTSRQVLGQRLRDLVQRRWGFSPLVFLLTREDLQSAVEQNPFAEASAEPKTLHFSFLAEPACDADLDALESLRASSERWKLTDTVFYLHAPEGIGRSKLAARIERVLKVGMTSRNFRTVDKLLAMALAAQASQTD